VCTTVPRSTPPEATAFAKALITNSLVILASTAQPTTRLLNFSCQLAR